MSCKIINGGDAQPVGRFEWGPAHAGAAGRAERSSSSRPFQSQDTGAAGDIRPQLEQARQQGIQEGLRQAEEALQQRMKAQMNDVGSRLAASLGEVAALRPRLRHQAEAQVVELALLVARKILHRALAMDPDALTGLVTAALSRIDARELLEIRVPAVHLGAVKAALDRLGLPSQVQLIADASLEPGAVLIESGRGRLDASVSTQLAEIERGFADSLATGGAA
ncbi:MAG TPA: FliH/SctL family protein [Bryobacteraceae bacterium]|nr:FliH/SctL family protein [Bryobacteraceae bacterium]